jgi:hypothetical protein
MCFPYREAKGDSIMDRGDGAAVLLGFVLVAFACGGGSPIEEKAENPGAREPYFGQKPPGDVPVIFAPGIVSTPTGEWSMAATADGLEVFFGLATEDATFILHSFATHDGPWTDPVIAPFSGEFNDFDLTMSPDGNRLYFTSNRPTGIGGDVLENPDIWYVDRTHDGWGEPTHLDFPINTEDRELYPSESRDGFLYFFSSRPGGFGRSDIYRASYRDGEFGEPENLGESINSEASEGDACISPDGDYLVFTSTRDDGFGEGDLYVSFRTADGGWTKAVNLGNTVNTEYLEFCPSVSRDGRYLFFTSNRPKEVAITETTAVRRELGVAPRGDRPDIDIYWMDAGFIQDLRNQ